MRKPTSIIPPCGRSRQAIARWLASLCPHRGGRDYNASVHGRYVHGPWLFCWNVKLHSLDLSFDHLLEIARHAGCLEAPDDPFWIAGCRTHFATEVNTDRLYEGAVEDACRSFVGRPEGNVYYPDDDAYSQLWDGRPCVTQFLFGGRSGGWLVLARFNDHVLTTDLDLAALDYRELRDLAEMVWYVQRAAAGATRAVEHCAAFNLFNNLCAEVPTREQLAAAWASDWSAGHDFAPHEFPVAA